MALRHRTSGHSRTVSAESELLHVGQDGSPTSHGAKHAQTHQPPVLHATLTYTQYTRY